MVTVGRNVINKIFLSFSLYFLLTLTFTLASATSQDVLKPTNTSSQKKKVLRKAEIRSGDVVFGFRVNEIYDAKVVQIVDGDTLAILREDNSKEKIRLSSIDAPEIGQTFGKEAKKALKDLVLNKKVRILSIGIESRYQLLAFVNLDDSNINAELVRRGFAWHYRRYSDNAILAELESDARIAKRGLWANAEPKQPWFFESVINNGYKIPFGLSDYQEGVWDRKIVESFVTSCVGVSDGDTITVLDKQGKQLKIRIDIIDCPELGQPFGKEAKQAMTDLVLNKTVRVLKTGEFRDGLTLAFIRPNPEVEPTKNAGVSMLEKGLAWAERHNTKLKMPGWIEDGSKSKKRGLWADPNPTPPWEYRKK